MARLRGPQGCPWDAEQTHESLRVHLIEEAYEVLDAVDAGAVGPELEEELGDILLQVAFHCVIAQEERRFDFASVADRLSAKLVARHPHVFGDVVVSGAADVVGNWESLKQQEKARTGPFEGIPQGLPALLAAYKTQKRATSLGFAPDADLAARRVTEGIEEAVDPDGLGDLLFWVVALARAHGIDPEGALRAATTRFQKTHA
jgi:MazG family protein